MDPIISRGGHGYFFHDLTDPAEFCDPFPGHDYTCLLWDSTGRTDPGAREAMADALVATGCLYLVCGGAECDAWHDAADRAFITLDLPEPVYEERFVMTTWHTGESPEEVAFFFACRAEVEERPIRKHLVLQLGAGAEIMQRLKDEVRASVLHPEWEALVLTPPNESAPGDRAQ